VMMLGALLGHVQEPTILNSDGERVVATWRSKDLALAGANSDPAGVKNSDLRIPVSEQSRIWVSDPTPGRLARRVSACGCRIGIALDVQGWAASGRATPAATS